MKSIDNKRGRLEALRHVLSPFDHAGGDEEAVAVPDPLIVDPVADVCEKGERRLRRVRRTGLARSPHARPFSGTLCG